MLFSQVKNQHVMQQETKLTVKFETFGYLGIKLWQSTINSLQSGTQIKLMMSHVFREYTALIC